MSKKGSKQITSPSLTFCIMKMKEYPYIVAISGANVFFYIITYLNYNLHFQALDWLTWNLHFLFLGFGLLVTNILSLTKFLPDPHFSIVALIIQIIYFGTCGIIIDKSRINKTLFIQTFIVVIILQLLSTFIFYYLRTS